MTGKRATTTIPVFGRTWWGRLWVEALEQRGQLDPNRLPRGATHARDGSVTAPTFAPGEVTAQATGRLERPYEVRVRVRQFTDAEWDCVLEAVSGRLSHAAAMLDGDLPPAVAEDVAAAGLTLLPGPGEIGPRCTCPDEADPCKHSAAVCYLVADALDDEPFLLFLLRGRTRDEVLAGLRSRRRGQQRIPVQAAPITQPNPPAQTAGIDVGVDARTTLATRDHPLPPIPPVPVPAQRPGHPAALPVDPPSGHDGLRDVLLALAADAAARAWQLATGESADAGLELTEEEDLARRAARLIGTPRFETFAARCDMNPRELFRWGLAWLHGSAAGFAVLRGDWDPATESAGMPSYLTIARALLRDATGTIARVTRNRVTASRRQIRLGRDGLWYPYARAADGWQPCGPPHHDPAELTRLWRSTTVSPR